MEPKKFSALIDTQIERYRKLLPAHISAEKFVTAAKTFYVDAITKDTKNKLGSASEKSIMVALEKAAKEGLLMDGNEACWIVFGSEAQYSPMVWGLMKLIQNSGAVSKVSVYVVWSNEPFRIKIVNGEEQMEHEPLVFAPEKDKGERIGVYAAAKLTDGNVLLKFLSKEKVLKLRAKSKNPKLWDQEADEFWGKSALRQISKFLPKNSEEMKSVSSHLDSDIVVADEDGVVIENETGTPNENQPQPENNEEQVVDNREEISLPQQLRNEAESFKDRVSLKSWFESLPIDHKKEVATWITEVLNKLPKQEAKKPAPKKSEEEDIGNPNNWDQPQPQAKTTSKKLAAVVEEDDLEPAEEGDAF